jgi:hypothetical protein
MVCMALKLTSCCSSASRLLGTRAMQSSTCTSHRYDSSFLHLRGRGRLDWHVSVAPAAAAAAAAPQGAGRSASHHAQRCCRAARLLLAGGRCAGAAGPGSGLPRPPEQRGGLLLGQHAVQQPVQPGRRPGQQLGGLHQRGQHPVSVAVDQLRGRRAGAASVTRATRGVVTAQVSPGAGLPQRHPGCPGVKPTLPACSTASAQGAGPWRSSSSAPASSLTPLSSMSCSK